MTLRLCRNCGKPFTQVADESECSAVCHERYEMVQKRYPIVHTTALVAGQRNTGGAE